ncbi:elongation factor P--(R)-beta-lysine ligase [Agarivorans albus]|uniref:Translation elongation factor P Lys34:lysine transferase n=1 Tax=Agarivorans albus MKT 106 TaxID=1331007 RepID=R9PTD9_AGAAL|nr:elongation factor P--(R)-beta-lysine ligase [Agarivorans albus]GAD02251.1 translation elongation factor P Lys34:lysine transferase [Agarivorans albus MKT 106]
MSETLWQPSASIQTLQQRAKIINKIRCFFAKREVMEVDTPCLSQACVSDVHLHSFSTTLSGPAAPKTMPLYLQTSPEFHMKRLLAAGSGCIYQLAKAFRNEEAGRFHNPEFTMLEWYRIGFDHFALMDEMDELITEVLACNKAERLSYVEAFERHLGINPINASQAEFVAVAKRLSVEDLVVNEPDRDTILQLLFSLGVEPKIGQQRPCFVYHFPASQAALAKISAKDPQVAERFELYFKGIELANGFHELTDAKEQAARFAKDQQVRENMGLAAAQVDQHFLAALAAGLPACAGVALGIDRLLMLALGTPNIQAVQSFSVDRA